MYARKKSDIMIMWAEALEQKVNDGSIELEITAISNHIRKELIDMDLERAVWIMYESLPPKYKSNTPSEYMELYEPLTLENSNENSSLDYSLENITLINIAKLIQQVSTDLIRYLGEHKVDYQVNDEFAPSVAALAEAIKEKSKFVNDGRQKVCKLDQLHLLQILQESTLNSAFDELTAQKMAQSKMTSKQTRKFAELTIKEIDQALAPTTDLQAKQYGFLGVLCEECNKFRIKRVYNPDATEYQDHCSDCDHWQPMTMAIPAL